MRGTCSCAAAATAAARWPPPGTRCTTSWSSTRSCAAPGAPAFRSSSCGTVLPWCSPGTRGEERGPLRLGLERDPGDEGAEPLGLAVRVGGLDHVAAAGAAHLGALVGREGEQLVDGRGEG